jgi:hypothetical protein
MGKRNDLLMGAACSSEWMRFHLTFRRTQPTGVTGSFRRDFHQQGKSALNLCKYIHSVSRFIHNRIQTVLLFGPVM